MLRRWGKSRSWLVVWEALALVWFAVAVNRFYRTESLVSYDIGVTPMAWGLLMDLIRAATASVVCAVVGILPAAWVALGPTRNGNEPDNSGPSHPSRSSSLAGQSPPA